MSNKWIAEFELEDGDTMPKHMDLEYKGAKIDFHCKPLEQEPSIEKLKDKLHDKIEIHVCEVEENTLIAQGMLKALGMMDEVLEKVEKGGE